MAVAQTPSPTPSEITLPADLLQSVVNYLHNGGTRQEADALVKAVVDAAQKPQIEAQQKAEEQRKIDEAVSKALADAKNPPAAPTASASPNMPPTGHRLGPPHLPPGAEMPPGLAR